MPEYQSPQAYQPQANPNPYNASDWNNSFSPGQSHLGSGAGFGLDTGAGQAFSTIGDPLDLFGNRAGYAQQQQNDILNSAADRSINALREQYYTTQGLQQPFADLGTDALSGFGQYTQGENFAPQLREGANALAGSAAASGMLNSSNTGKNLSRFVNDLTQEDMNRQYQQQLNQVKIGQGAVGQIGAAGQNFGQGASGVYGNTGNMLAQNSLNYGQNMSNAFNTAGNAAGGLANYIGSQ